jgi:phenylalanyl-tRNA synthetase beta chain
VARTPAASADAVIDFEVTANRPDCLSVAGMAREIATAYGLQVRRPVAGGSSLALTSLKSVEQGDIDIAIESKELCPRYVGAVADVTVGPSPEWMQARLRAAGIRPISNIVDITNYVLIELGQPMHAFDSTKLGGGAIRVRTARPEETLRTLDGQMRTLTPEMLVIADAERAVAIAGVMGGGDSEVSAETQTIVFESAYFTPQQVRRTSKRLGLKTEASTRFERGTDPRLPVTAMERACALLELARAGTARGTLVDRYPLRLEPAVLRLRRDRINGTARDDGSRYGHQANTRESRVRAARGRAWMGRHRSDAPRRCPSRSGSHRGSRAAQRFRSHSRHLPCRDGGAATNGSAHHAGPRAAHDHDRRRFLRGGDVRLHLRILGSALRRGR